MDIASLPLHLFVGTAVAFGVPKGPGQDITASDVAACDIHPGDIVLFRTGWEELAGTPRFFAEEWPGLTVGAVDLLLSLHVKALGGDSPSADSPRALVGQDAPAHRQLLAAGVPIFEALVNLEMVVGKRFVFVGVPLKLEGAEASPVRAIAVLS
jgi:kynurenine formamidase